MRIKTFLYILITVLLFSCTNDKQSELEIVSCVDVFTYTDCVKTIIQENCIVCHNSGINPVGPFPLETYEQVRNVAENGAMLDRIQRPDGADGIMPQTGKMTQSKIDAILTWAAGGFEE